MRIGIMVDATCDLPQDFFAQAPVEVMPIGIRIDDREFIDTHDLAAAVAYYQDEISKRGHSGQTRSLDTAEIRELFLDRLVLEYDCVFCLTVTASRSQIHANATEASYAILREYRARREAAGVPGPFLLRVIDSQALFAAQGIAALETARLIAAGTSPGRIRQRLEALTKHTWTYVIPRDLHYIRARTKGRGDHSVSFLAALLGGAMDIKPILQGYRGETRPVFKARGFDSAAEALFRYASERVGQRLLTHALTISYGGDLEELDALPGYAALREACSEHGIRLQVSTMSITGMVNLGPGSLSLGFASEPHEATF